MKLYLIEVEWCPIATGELGTSCWEVVDTGIGTFIQYTDFSGIEMRDDSVAEEFGYWSKRNGDVLDARLTYIGKV